MSVQEDDWDVNAAATAPGATKVGTESSAHVGLSIIIPTRNSASRIGATLEALETAVDRLDHVAAEIIVVDNASDEDIHTPIKAFWARRDRAGPRRIMREQRLGAAYARLKGFQEARYPVVVYCDDDVLPASDSLQLISEIGGREADVGGGGGWIRPRLVDGAEWPAWMDNGLMVNLAVFPGDCPTTYTPPASHYPVSALVWFRKEALAGWAPLMQQRDAFVFGPAGKEMWRGDDFEMDITAGRAGWRLKVDSRITAEHCIPPSRLTRDYFASLLYWNGRTSQRWRNKWFRRSWAYDFLRLVYRVVWKRDPLFARAFWHAAKNAPAPLTLDPKLDDAAFNRLLHELYAFGVAEERVLRILKPSIH